jgi:hypothetical protein
MTATYKECVRWIGQTPLWFRGAIALGFALRLYLCLFTEGTYDVAIWRGHAEKIGELGLIRYYHSNPLANHPPFISEVFSWMLSAGQHSAIPFRVLLRLPFVLIDAGTLALLLSVLAHHERRLVLAAAYWLHPLSLLFSAYHGNTDSSVAFFVLLSGWLLAQKKTIAAAMAIGVGLWIKLPVVVAVPALLLLLDGWRDRLLFLTVAASTGVSTYLPALVADPRIVIANVFGYHGQLIQNSAGVPVWGWYRVLMPFVATPEWLNDPGGLVEVLINQGWRIALGLNLFLVWQRRSLRSLPDVCATIATGYVLIYGLTEHWSFQYFAWSVPFWCFMPSWFFVGATAVTGGYIYSLYGYLCGNPWLLGRWDFVGRPVWPAGVILLRDLSVGFYFVSAWWLLIRAAVRAVRSGRGAGASNPGSPGSGRWRA